MIDAVTAVQEMNATTEQGKKIHEGLKKKLKKAKDIVKIQDILLRFTDPKPEIDGVTALALATHIYNSLLESETVGF